MDSIKTPLMGMNRDELKEVAKSLGMPAFAGGQIADWLYRRHVTTIDEMTNLSKANREKLKAGVIDMINKGKTLVSDRYIFSSLAYQSVSTCNIRNG